MPWSASLCRVSSLMKVVHASVVLADRPARLCASSAVSARAARFNQAFGGGADFVMLGGMLAGHKEGGGKVISKNGKNFIEFYGSSSEEANTKHYGGLADYRSSEGKKDGHYVFINELQTLSLLYKNDNLIEWEPILGFSGGKVDDSVIDQDMFSEYMNSYGKGDPPVRRKAKGVPIIKRIN